MNNAMILNKIDTRLHSKTIGLKAYLSATGYKLLVALTLTLYLMMPVFTHFIIHKFSLTAL